MSINGDIRYPSPVWPRPDSLFSLHETHWDSGERKSRSKSLSSSSCQYSIVHAPLTRYMYCILYIYTWWPPHLLFVLFLFSFSVTDMAFSFSLLIFYRKLLLLAPLYVWVLVRLMSVPRPSKPSDGRAKKSNGKERVKRQREKRRIRKLWSDQIDVRLKWVPLSATLYFPPLHSPSFPMELKHSPPSTVTSISCYHSLLLLGCFFFSLDFTSLLPSIYIPLKSGW